MSALELRRDETPPFLVKLFYRTGAFHRPDEFNAPSLPPHLTVHAWKDCTLTELSHYMVGASPPILPDPAIGTRLAFRLIYADTRARMDLPPRYVAKDLGSVVLGGGGPGAGADEGFADDEPDDGSKTLADARFITGDYISCAILPPNELTGDVTPASSARMGRGVGVGEARALTGAPPPPPSSRERDYAPPGVFRGRGFRGGGPRGYGGRRYSDRDEPFGRGGGGIPEGEWRRDMLPEDELSGSNRWGR
ncbi:Sin3 associated polypeptide p18-domain-containing protein [Achaetomium macrosporum]|uniref:Sin3 associated polypeptide p18-domain-containing protein n=1 Tax=Achaetomium macrosporum TaxID=79813 RepID=A0AAN7HC04_9PEZI|nr:Sin3 associated polypeptide p18-domain-containing protein [Achaetomium macrosporum]